MTSPPIHELLHELDRDLLADPKGPGVAALLEAYARDHDDWRRYAHSVPSRYARNLVRSTADYELIVICWREGQSSPIHDHDGQRCWMVVLEGTLQETLFEHPDRGVAAPLRARSERSLAPGQVCFITDDIALHEIRPVHGPGITLHLYANPIGTCRSFDPATGAAEERTLRFDSIQGELQPACA
jgi:cysteine dioxygenase